MLVGQPSPRARPGKGQLFDFCCPKPARLKSTRQADQVHKPARGRADHYYLAFEDFQALVQEQCLAIAAFEEQHRSERLSQLLTP